MDTFTAMQSADETEMEQVADTAPEVSEPPWPTGEVRLVPCDACGHESFQPLFHKQSSREELFRVVRCEHCGLVQVNPQPDAAAVAPYYGDSYFERRTDRGYDNYYSEELKAQINRVYAMNLRDLGFEKFESEALFRGLETATALDVGCAAGYFVEFMADRAWDSRGIELAEGPALYAREHMGLNVTTGDFLTHASLEPGSFDLVTLWASIEHMHSPRRVLERTHELLRPGGRMLLSTCRYGVLAKARGAAWRYMNVPEHLYFFSLPGLKALAHDTGFAVEASITYGSGMTMRPGAGPLFRTLKRIADPAVKRLNQGDMMALHLRKV